MPAAENQEAEMKTLSVPVYQLHLSLRTDGLDADGWEILRRYGHVEKELSRDILIRGDMMLHTLHYAIQRAFGWTNSHLHAYRLPEQIFQKMTGGTVPEEGDPGPVRHDGSFAEWKGYCGLYFRFPSTDYEDLYWDDDYSEGQDPEIWMRQKYLRPNPYRGQSEHRKFIRHALEDFVLRFPEIPSDPLVSPEKNRERMVQVPVERSILHDIENFHEGNANELLERLPVMDVMVPAEELDGEDELRDELAVLKKIQVRTDSDLPTFPVTSSLIYVYDYGDGWTVEITAVRRVTPEEISEIPHLPFCASLDGIQVMDDVGGICGFADFLRTIHEGTAKDIAESREWAENLWDWSENPKDARTLL